MGEYPYKRGDGWVSGLDLGIPGSNWEYKGDTVGPLVGGSGTNASILSKTFTPSVDCRAVIIATTSIWHNNNDYYLAGDKIEAYLEVNSVLKDRSWEQATQTDKSTSIDGWHYDPVTCLWVQSMTASTEYTVDFRFRHWFGYNNKICATWSTLSIFLTPDADLP